MAKKTSRNTLKIALIAAGVLVLASGATLFIIRHGSTPDTPASPAGVNLNPPTKEEKLEADQNKDGIVEQQQSAPPQSNGKKTVSVFISAASKDSVKAIVNGIIEDNGQCSATFTQGSTVITRTSSGFSNVSYTQCAPISPDLPNNNGWSVVVSYSSGAASGSSQAQTF